MKIYVSKRNENVTAKVIREDKESKTVVLEYLTGDKSGQNSSVTESTLKRWWKAMESNDNSDKREKLSPSSKAYRQEEPNGGDKEVKDKKSSSCAKEKSLVVDKIEKYPHIYKENVNVYKIFQDTDMKKCICEVYPRRKHIEVRVKNAIKNVTCDYKDGYKYFLPVHYFISYENTNYIDILSNIIDGCL